MNYVLLWVVVFSGSVSNHTAVFDNEAACLQAKSAVESQFTGIFSGYGARSGSFATCTPRHVNRK